MISSAGYRILCGRSQTAMKKISDRSFDFFAVLSICGIWYFYRNDIVSQLNDIFLSLFGKNLSGRNLPVRAAVYSGLFLAYMALPFLFDRLVRRNPKIRKAADFLITGVLFFPLVRLMIICVNQVLRRDDFWEIADAREFGFPGSMIVEIRRYNGRYLSWGLRSLYAILPPIPFIRIILCLNIMIFTAGASMLAYQLMKCQTRKEDLSGIRIQAFLTGSAIVFAGILMASNIWEFWFWGSGVMVYGLGLSLCVLTVALALRIAMDPSPRTGSLIPAMILCIPACGCSELCTASLAVFMLIILVWKRILTKRWDRRVFLLLIEVLICCAGIFLLSGSMKYAGGYAHIGEEPQKNALAVLIKRLPVIISWAFNALWGYLFINTKLLLLFMGIFFIFGTQLHFTARTRKQLMIIAVLLIITGQGVLFINSALDYMPPRVVTVGICWVMAAAALICFTMGSFFSGSRLIPDRAKIALCAVLLSLCIGRFYTSNIEELRTIRGSWTVRDLVLQQTAGSGEDTETCSLPCKGSFREDILSDPESEYNTGIASYYGFSSIHAEHRCPPYGPSFIDFSDDGK